MIATPIVGRLLEEEEEATAFPMLRASAEPAARLLRPHLSNGVLGWEYLDVH